jgi:hypothetical protein
VLHELPCEQGKCKRSTVPVDGRIDVDGFQYGEQLSLLVLKRRKEGFASQRTSIVIVLSGPIHLSGRQRGVVETPRTQTTCRSCLQNGPKPGPILCGTAAQSDFLGGSGVKFHLSSGTARTKSTVKP